MSGLLVVEPKFEWYEIAWVEAAVFDSQFTPSVLHAYTKVSANFRLLCELGNAEVLHWTHNLHFSLNHQLLVTLSGERRRQIVSHISVESLDLVACARHGLRQILGQSDRKGESSLSRWSINGVKIYNG